MPNSLMVRVLLPDSTVFIKPGAGPDNFRMITPKVVAPALEKWTTSTGSLPTFNSTPELPELRIVVQAASVNSMSKSLFEPGAPLTEKNGWSHWKATVTDWRRVW